MNTRFDALISRIRNTEGLAILMPILEQPKVTQFLASRDEKRKHLAESLEA